MLISYLDETGHSKDERQKFVGVAGLIAPHERWRIFERKWKKTLNKFKIPAHDRNLKPDEQGYPQGIACGVPLWSVMPSVAIDIVSVSASVNPGKRNRRQP